MFIPYYVFVPWSMNYGHYAIQTPAQRYAPDSEEESIYMAWYYMVNYGIEIRTS